MGGMVDGQGRWRPGVVVSLLGAPVVTPTAPTLAWPLVLGLARGWRHD